MDFGNVWSIASKDFSIFFKKKGIVISVILLPLLTAFGLSLVLHYAIDQPTFQQLIF